MMSVMIGSVTERLAPDSDFMIFDNLTNSTIIDLAYRDAERVRVAAAVTCLSGLFQVCGPVVHISLKFCYILLVFRASYLLVLSSAACAGSSWFTSTWFFGDLFV